MILSATILGMLGLIYSFYEKNIHPTVLWDRVPGPPSAKKVALCALCIFGLYKIYRAYTHSLHSRVTQADEDTSSDNNSPPSNISATGLLPHAPVSDRAHNDTSDTSAPEDEFFDAYDQPYTLPDSTNGKDNETPPVLTVMPAANFTSSAIDRFKQRFPGQDLTCVVEEKTTTFAQFILQKLVRIDDVSECKDLGENKFQLTHHTSKTACFTRLTENVPTWIHNLIQPILNAQVTFANPMTIQFVEDHNSTGFSFLDQAITATKQVNIGYSVLSTTVTYICYLNKVWVFTEPKDSHTIYVEAEHNSTVLAQFKQGCLNHQKFVNMLHANL